MPKTNRFLSERDLFEIRLKARVYPLIPLDVEASAGGSLENRQIRDNFVIAIERLPKLSLKRHRLRLVSARSIIYAKSPARQQREEQLFYAKRAVISDIYKAEL